MNIDGTRLETDEEVRRAVQRHRPTAPGRVVGARARKPADDSPPLFRPTRRPAMLALTVFDDGSEEGETLRIRNEQFVIGRTDGDLVIPHDGQISGRHAEIRRVSAGGQSRWRLVDLSSTNGVYVRVRNAVLQHGQQFAIGRTRFRFDFPAAAIESSKAADPARQTTQLWQSGLNERLAPSIVEVLADGDGRRTLVQGREAWLGKDSEDCQVALADDPFASARHARIHQDEEGRWLIENNKSINGVWLRIERLTIKDSCRFLLGEQQFMARPLA